MKLELVRCIACGKTFAKRTRRQLEHLSTCVKYQEQMSIDGKSSIGTSNLDAGQTCITSRVQHLSPTEKHDADISFALAIYMNNLSFKVTQSPYLLAPVQNFSPA